MVRTRAARRRDAPSLVSDTWAHTASFLGAADLFRVEGVSRGHRAVVGSLTQDVWRGVLAAAASPQLSELCRASHWSPRTFARAWLQRWRAAGPGPSQVDEKPMLCVPWNPLERVAQADGPHVVFVVDGRAEIMAPDLVDPSSSDPPHPLAGHRLMSHLTNDKVYSDDDVVDLTTSCLLIARDGSSIIELWDNATTDDFDGGITFEHGGIELVAVDPDGVNVDVQAQVVMTAIRERENEPSFPADVGFVTLMAYLHFDDEDEPVHRMLRAELSWSIHEYDTLRTMDEVTSALAAALDYHPASDPYPYPSAVFQEGS